MKLNYYRATDLLNSDYEKRMPEEVASLFYSYVHCNLRMFKDFGSALANEDWNHVITVENDNGEILGFRYYHWQGNKNNAHFFAVVIADAIKRQGYALATFHKAVEHANTNGIRKFEITVNSEDTVERSALFEAYKRECTLLSIQNNSFYVTHMGKEFRV